VKEKKQRQSFFDGLINALIAFSCIFAIVMLLVVLIYSIRYWNEGYKILINTGVELQQRMFFVGILIAIIGGNLFFLELFIKGFAETFRCLFKK